MKDTFDVVLLTNGYPIILRVILLKMFSII